MSQHTPGPWKADDRTVLAPGQNGSARTVAEVCGLGLKTMMRDRANARLIAAAPDLLRHLEVLLAEHAEETHPDRDRSPRKPFAERLYVQDAMAAIEAARGPCQCGIADAGAERCTNGGPGHWWTVREIPRGPSA